jgi:hypothetical protein
MSKPFEDLYDYEDPITGNPLEWEWDSEERQFIATDRSGKIYRIIPITAELEIEQSDDDLEGEEDLED